MNKIILANKFKTFSITQRFGATTFAMQNPTYYPPGGHNGIDYGIPIGTPIYTTHSGYCVQDNDIGKQAKGIYIVIVDPDQNIATHYYHLSRNFFNYGDYIRKGDLIGLSGSTGLSTGPHLHFGLCIVDPVTWVRIDKDNGFNGFIDPLNSDLVEWEDD